MKEGVEEKTEAEEKGVGREEKGKKNEETATTSAHC